MHFSNEEKTVLLSITLLIIIIPVISLIVSWRLQASNSAQIPNQGVLSASTHVTNAPVDPLEELKKNLAAQATPSASPDSTPEPEVQAYYGPSLSFRINIEGRPSTDQSAKVFLGIAQDQPTSNPKFILSYVVNVPKTGVVSNISLAGLSQGGTYTAFIKGESQLATSSAFVVRTLDNDLGLMSMLTGDLNEDNVIDDNDYSVVKNNFGMTTKSAGWNPLADFNLDSMINSLDLGFLVHNKGKIGAGGPWYSKIGLTALTNSNSAIGGPDSTQSATEPATTSAGTWLFIPNN